MFDLITIGDSGCFQGKWVLLQLEAAVLARPPTTLSFIPNAHYEGPEGHYFKGVLGVLVAVLITKPWFVGFILDSDTFRSSQMM